MNSFPLDSCFLFSNSSPVMMVSMFFFMLTGHCWEEYDKFSCALSKYWNNGFVALQTVINAAIIEVSLQFKSYNVTFG